MLDEIGELKLPLQAKLLHVLQSGEFSPLGSEKHFKANIWIIAATNRNLEQCVKEGLFREDLYFRLNIVKINVPPLRERIEDLSPLVNFYLQKYEKQMNRKEHRRPSTDTLDKMRRYSWPGNVRELQNFIRRFLLVNDWEQMTHELRTDGSPGASDSGRPNNNLSENVFIKELLSENCGMGGQPLKPFSLKKIKRRAQDHVEKEVLTYVLKKTGWNRTKAVDILDISYKTLLYKIDYLNLKAS